MRSRVGTGRSGHQGRGGNPGGVRGVARGSLSSTGVDPAITGEPPEEQGAPLTPSVPSRTGRVRPVTAVERAVVVPVLPERRQARWYRGAPRPDAGMRRPRARAVIALRGAPGELPEGPSRRRRV